MPELQALYKEIQSKNVNVVGIVADGMGNKTALQIVKQQGVNYSNIVPDQRFMDDFVSLTSVVPVSLLVNRKGEIMGKQIIGSRSKEEFKEIIEDNLKLIEGPDNEK